jgi:large subunit ribosomal protein L6
MSRIGRMPIAIPNGVEVKVGNENFITVKGPNGLLEKAFNKDMIIAVADGQLSVKRPNEEKMFKSLHGLTRTILANMVTGVTTGFVKELDINGVGYRVAKQGNKIVMNLGYSHQVEMEEIPGITLDCPTQNKIIVKGPDKQAVGQFAANIREKRPPEPYKGKGIKYSYEVIIRKEGKTGAKKK